MNRSSQSNNNSNSISTTFTGSSYRSAEMPPPPSLSLSRYASAPGSFFTSLAAESSSTAAATGAAVVDHGSGLFGRFFPGESSSSSLSLESGSKMGPDLQRPYNGTDSQMGNNNPLVRHSSSPARFFSNLLIDNNCFSVMKGTGSCSRDDVHDNQRLKSQLSFTRQSTLSQISEEDTIPDLGERMGGNGGHTDETGCTGTGTGRSYTSSEFSIGSWDDTNSIAFSTHAGKRAKDNNGDILTSLTGIDSQFSMPRNSFEMTTVEKYLHLQPDEVPFKVRAKRGCATHPRSIAERERRTRISEKLRKLQELVPNMDNQTSTADMLDLAVQHIKGLQNQVQTLTQEQDRCTCGSKNRKK